MARLKLRATSAGLSLPGKFAIGLVFLLLVGAAYFVIFYGDVETAITQAEDQHTALKAQLADAEVSKAQYQKDREEKEQREQKLAKQKKSLPDEAEWPSFLSTVQSLATMSGVKLSSWKPNDEQFEDFYVRLPMELAIEGKFHQVAKFFNSVGQTERIINMENIRITLVKEKGADAGPKGVADQPEAQEATVTVQVKCLATAFRALKGDEAGRSKRKKGAPGQPATSPAKTPAAGAAK
ncbi:MAG: type 4a pilus biogenesis protein PilO [Polyangiaceae bacterium]|nr:type 4a pilus biogenesis protein PilO [Polyangiaceae bacterium]